jgi:hypothetical protein
MNPTSLAARLQQFLVESLGVAAPLLGAQWASSNPTYNGVDATGDSTPPMSLTFSGAWTAPFTGMLSYSGSGTDAQFTLDGLVITGSVAVLSQHPHAHLRLRDMFASRFGNDGSSHSVRPVPMTAVIRMSSPPSPLPDALSLVNAGDTTNTLPAGTVTFHDANGLLIDPLFVASAWTDILNNFETLGQAALRRVSSTRLRAMSISSQLSIPRILVTSTSSTLTAEVGTTPAVATALP